MKDTPRMTNDEMMAQLGRGKDKSEGMTASIRDSLREMNEMMDDHEAQKKPGADLRNGMPAQLEKLNDAWLQTDDLGAVRDAMNQDADAQKVARYEDEYSVISRCRFKYNPIHELQRYIPAVGVRALLTNRGVAVEILGDPRDLADAKRWKRRIRIASSQASCGPMDRPTGERHVPSTFPLQSSTVSSFFKRRSIAGVRAVLCMLSDVCLLQGCYSLYLPYLTLLHVLFPSHSPSVAILSHDLEILPSFAVSLASIAKDDTALTDTTSALS